MSTNSSTPSSLDVKKMLRNLKLAQMKVRNTLELFNPIKYPSEVVNANKDVWIKRVEDAFDVVTELSLDLEEFVLPEDYHEMFKTNEALKDEIYKFVLSTNIVSLSIKVPQNPHPVVSNFEDSKIKPKLDHGQFPTFPGNNENALKANERNEDDHIEQLQCLESAQGSIPDPINNLLLHECSQEAANEVEEEHHRSLGEEKDVQFSSALQDLLKLVSVNQKFHRHLFDYGTLRSVMLKFPIQEMHVMLQMSRGSIQRFDCILDYIQLFMPRYVDSMSYIHSVSTNANASFARS